MREQSLQSGFSLMTVLSAYQQLEAQGLIYSKQKSGFYVAYTLSDQTQTAQSLQHTAIIEINSQVFHYLKDTQQQDIITLCSAFPDHELLFNHRLMGIIALGKLYF
nr:GntR family transcriptional regulator [uncultured Acinetobacter sp.]